MKIVIIDKRDNFLSDIQTRLLLDDRDIDLVGQSVSSAEVNTLVEEGQPDILVIADNVLNEQEDWVFPNCTTIGYLTKRTETDPFAERGIAAYGYISSSEYLLNSLHLGLPKKKTESKAQPVQSFYEDDDEDLPNFAEQGNPVQQTEQQVSQQPSQDDIEIPKAYEPPVNLAQQRESAQYDRQYNAEPNYDLMNAKEKLNSASALYNSAAQSSKLKADLERQKKKTTVVTVYSAKGGVGKTTISAELATYLARTSIGRGYLRVCIIDCNIDFGDVLTTLDFDPKACNLTYWAAEVKERLQRGEAKEDIVYDKAGIEERLQRDKNTGLYALVAPISHADSMDIESVEMEIIFKSILNNGEFDYIIFDTGNNTRDSSMLALENAHYILLVATQDVSTASCNSAFLATMQKIGFDTNKIFLVVNNIMPYKTTQVSVEEVEQMFPYKCLARIKRSPDVTRANNCSEPIVLTDIDHQFTKEIQKIVAYLTGQKVPDVGKKQGFFKKLFKKKE